MAVLDSLIPSIFRLLISFLQSSSASAPNQPTSEVTPKTLQPRQTNDQQHMCGLGPLTCKKYFILECDVRLNVPRDSRSDEMVVAEIEEMANKPARKFATTFEDLYGDQKAKFIQGGYSSDLPRLPNIDHILQEFGIGLDTKNKRYSTEPYAGYFGTGEIVQLPKLRVFRFRAIFALHNPLSGYIHPRVAFQESIPPNVRYIDVLGCSNMTALESHNEWVRQELKRRIRDKNQGFIKTRDHDWHIPEVLPRD